MIKTIFYFTTGICSHLCTIQQNNNCHLKINVLFHKKTLKLSTHWLICSTWLAGMCATLV